MANHKKISAIKPIKNAFEIVSEGAIKKHIEHPKCVAGIERVVEVFRAREQRGEIVDSFTELEKFKSAIENVCAPRVTYLKSSAGQKKAPGKTSSRCLTITHTQLGGKPKKRKKPAARKRHPPKSGI